MNKYASQSSSNTLSNLKSLINRILPLVDDLADALGVFLIAALLIIGWIFIYLYSLQSFSITISLSIAMFFLLPWLVLLRIWFALESLKKMPETINDLVEDVSDETSESFNAVRSGKMGVFNVIGQARKLFQIRTLLKTGSDIFEEYFSIGPLINPFYLLFAVISLVSLTILLFSGSILAIISVL